MDIKRIETLSASYFNMNNNGIDRPILIGLGYGYRVDIFVITFWNYQIQRQSYGSRETLESRANA